MKKKAKKLVLSKETVRGLGNMTLDKVVGGATEYCGNNGSNVTACTYYNSCQIYCLDEPIGP